MGYTHYWYQTRSFSDSEWAMLQTAASKLIAGFAPPIAFEYDDPDSAPIVDNDEIRFNGVGDDGHETFVLKREPRGRNGFDGRHFDCCKTAYKPYDPLVVAILLAAHHINPDLDWHSDGEANDHTEGADMAATLEIPYHMNNHDD